MSKANDKVDLKNRMPKAPPLGQEQKLVLLQSMKIETMKLKLIGDSPLVINRFSEKAQTEIETKQAGKAKPKTGGRAKREPKKEYQAAKWLDVKKKDCLPALYFKMSFVAAAARFYHERQRPLLYGSLWVKGNTITPDGEDAVKLKFKKVEMCTKHVRLQGVGRPLDLRYRPMYHDWSCDLVIDYDASVLTREAVAEFVARAGFSVGLCEWRAEKGGPWGRFRIATKGE